MGLLGDGPVGVVRYPAVSCYFLQQRIYGLQPGMGGLRKDQIDNGAGQQQNDCNSYGDTAIRNRLPRNVDVRIAVVGHEIS